MLCKNVIYIHWSQKISSIQCNVIYRKNTHCVFEFLLHLKMLIYSGRGKAPVCKTPQKHPKTQGYPKRMTRFHYAIFYQGKAIENSCHVTSFLLWINFYFLSVFSVSAAAESASSRSCLEKKNTLVLKRLTSSHSVFNSIWFLITFQLLITFEV